VNKVDLYAQDLKRRRSRTQAKPPDTADGGPGTGSGSPDELRARLKVLMVEGEPAENTRADSANTAGRGKAREP